MIGHGLAGSGSRDHLDDLRDVYLSGSS
jgi:hypothetical protein